MEENHDSPHKAPQRSNSKLYGGIALAVLLAAISFYGGLAYQKHQQKTITTSAFLSNGNGQYPSGGFGGGSGRRMSGFGTVTAINSASISIRNPRNNSTITYTINDSTTITDNGSTAISSDIKSGDTVIIRTSSASSTTATEIMVNPSFGDGQSGSSGTPGTTEV